MQELQELGAGNTSILRRTDSTRRQSGSSTEGPMPLPRLSGAQATMQDGSQKPMQHELPLQLQLQRREGAACLQRAPVRATREVAHRCQRRIRQRGERLRRAQIPVGLPLHGEMAQVGARTCLPTMNAQTAGQRRSRCERATMDMPERTHTARRTCAPRCLPLELEAVAGQQRPLEDTGIRSRSRNSLHTSRHSRAASSSHSMSLTQPPPCATAEAARRHRTSLPRRPHRTG